MINLEKDIKAIKAAGFSHFKVELEAQLHREDSERAESQCENCDGDGIITLTDRMGNDYDDIECASCYGEGYLESEYGNSFADEDYCEQWIKDHLSAEALAAINYMNFYNDGSVDSELTFTLPIDNPKYAIEVIEVWNQLAEEIGQGVDVDGAGMHISVLTSGNYPSSQMLPTAKLNNFVNEVSKLLPALFVAATSGDFTRGFTYRKPQIDHHDKYSAIFTHRGTCLEYRLFETCYQRPTAIYEYLGTIAKTLQYYTDPTKKVTTMGRQYKMYEHQGLKGLTGQAEQLEVIKKQFMLVKPEGYTIKQMMEDRGIDFSITKARIVERAKARELEKAYKEHVKAWETDAKRPLSEYEQRTVDEYRSAYPNESHEWIMRRAIGRSLVKPDKQTFINSNRNTRNYSAVVAV